MSLIQETFERESTRTQTKVYMCIRSDSGKEGEEETFCYYFGDLLVVRHPKEEIRRGKSWLLQKFVEEATPGQASLCVTSVPLHLLN